YTFVLQNTIQWAMGPALGITCLVGLAVGTWRLVRGHAREREALLVLIWTLLNLAYFGGQFAKFLRYMLPTYFTLVMLAAYVLLLATDRLPLARPGQDPGRYRYAELALYDPETPDKRAKLEGVLDQSQYVIMASRRLSASIPRLPERYPLATTYYRLLQSGELGFELM